MHYRLERSVLVFEDIEFELVDLRNGPWLKGAQIAAALGYKNPKPAISNLYRRKADEFTASMTRLVVLSSPGGPQLTRIFSPLGCYLLSMVTRTKRAKAFRRWVLDVLESRVVPNRPALSFPQYAAARFVAVH